MAEIIDFKLSKEEYIELADKSLREGSAEKSINYLTKALELDERSAEASIKLAQIYSGLGATAISNAVLFKTLGKHPDEEDESRIFYQLALNFLELGDMDVVSYYLRDFEGDFDIEYMESEQSANAQAGGFRLAYPKGDDYYGMLIEKAYSMVRERNFDEAIELLKEVDPRSKSADAANHVILVCYMMKNDLDRVIDAAEEMLKIKDSLAVKCSLATAYMMEEKPSEAYRVLDEILQKDYTRLEDMLLLLPILINLEVHAEIVKYTKRVLDNLNLQPNTMIWLSQGLYNLGQKDEAKKVMHRVYNIYRDYSPAKFFLELYEQNAEKVEYSMSLPYNERFARYKHIEEYLKTGTVDFARALLSDPALKKLINWAFIDGNEKIEFMLIAKLDTVKNSWIKDFYREQLLQPELSFELMSRLLSSLLDNGYILEADVVAQDRFKSVCVCLPDTFYHLPRIFRDAVGYCVCDIIYTDEEPDEYLDRLRRIVNEVVGFNEEGKLVYLKPKTEKIALFRSMRTLVGVLLAKVYEDDEDPRENTIERYNLNARTFDKYYRIIFGDEDGRNKE